MRPIRLSALNAAQLEELDRCYRGAAGARVRIRALMVLLAAERGMVAAEIAAVVRQDEETVRRWLREGDLRGYNFGGKSGYRIRASDLEAFIESYLERPETGKAAA